MEFFRGRLFVFALLAFFFCLPSARAGGGKIRVTEDSSGIKRGELELEMNFLYDPPADAIDYYEKLVKTASTILCDATEGYLRIGKVRFTKSRGGQKEADVWIVDQCCGGVTHGRMGSTGGHVQWFNYNRGPTLTHELGHYVWGVLDSYHEGSNQGLTCEAGKSFEDNTDNFFDFSGYLDVLGDRLHNHTVMDSTIHAVCQIKLDDRWYVPLEAGDDDGLSCQYVEECLDATQYDDTEPVDTMDLIYGQGTEDTVRCYPVQFSEYSVKTNHDLLHGIGEEFDSRLIDGSWGWGDSTQTYRQQLDAFLDFALDRCDSVADPLTSEFHDDAGNCLLGCPEPRATQTLDADIRFDMDDVTFELPGSFPSVGDIVPYADLYDYAAYVGSRFVYDNVGRDGEKNCDVEYADSMHSLRAFLFFSGLTGGTRSYHLVFAMPQPEFDATDDTWDDPTGIKNLRILHVEDLDVDNAILEAVPYGDIYDYPSAITVPISGLRQNECNLLGESPATPGSMTVSLNVAFERYYTKRIFLTNQQGAVEDCGWERSDRWCALAWQAYSDSEIHDGERTTSAQTMGNGEWDWSTLKRRLSWIDTQFNDVNDLPRVENPECFCFDGQCPGVESGGYDVVIEDKTSDDADVFLVADRSGSMRTTDGASGAMRITNTRAAATNYVDFTNSMIGHFGGGEVNFGFSRYNDDVECFGVSGLEACDSYTRRDIGVEANRDDFIDVMNSELEDGDATGSTALMDAVYKAAIQIKNNPTEGAERYVYLVTDGRENASEEMETLEQLIDEIIEAEVTVYAIAVGQEADFEFLQELTDETGGLVAYSGNADSIINVFHSLTAESKGGSTLIPLDQIVIPAGEIIIEQTLDPYTFDVEAGAEVLTVVLSNHGYAEEGVYPADGEIVSWELNMVLEAPGGQQYTLEHVVNPDYTVSVVASPEITYVPDSHILVQIPNPPAGEWSLLTEGRDTADKNAYVTVGVTNPNARVFVDASPKIALDADELVVTPTVAYGGIGIDVNTVTCTGKVFGPAGFEVPLTFENTRERTAIGEPPQARLEATDLNGRGAYWVEVKCDVTADAEPVIPISSMPPIEPFAHTATDFFFLSSVIMPPCASGIFDDCDGDGVLDVDEAEGDTDGDGWIDIHDKDSDNDDVDDGDDNCPGEFNPDQADSNADGIGDACKIFPDKVLFVANGYYPEEPVIYNHLVGVGSEVKVKKDYKIRATTDLSEYDLILITGFSPNISNKGLNNIKSSGIPVLIVEYWDFWYSYKFGMVEDDWCGTMYTTHVEMTSYDHEITDSLNDLEVVYNTQAVMIGTPLYSVEPGTIPLIYSTVQYDQAALLVDESKEVVVTGIHQVDNYTAVGWEIFDNSLRYLVSL